MSGHEVRIYDGTTSTALAIEAGGKEVYRVVVTSGREGRTDVHLGTEKGIMRLGAVDPQRGVWIPGPVRY